MSNNRQRDELAREIFITDNARNEDPAALWDEADHERMHYAEVIADGLIAKGYRKPRTIGTFTELLEVKQGAVVIDKTGAVMQLKATDNEGPFGRWFIMGELGSFPYSSVYLPATVLHEPEAEATR